MNLCKLGLLLFGIVFLGPLPGARTQVPLNPEDYVRQLYRFVLERDPSKGEVELWAGNIRRGTPPEDVRAAFLGSDEFFKKHHRNGLRFLNALSLHIYRRPITVEETEVLSGRLVALGGNRQALAAEMIHLAARPAPPPPPPPVVVVRLPGEPVAILTPHAQIVGQAEATIVITELFLHEIDQARDTDAVAAVRADARRLQRSLHKIRRSGAANATRGELRDLLREANEDWRVLRERRHALNVAIPTLRLAAMSDVNDGMELLGQLIRQLDQ